MLAVVHHQAVLLHLQVHRLVLPLDHPVLPAVLLVSLPLPVDLPPAVPHRADLLQALLPVVLLQAHLPAALLLPVVILQVHPLVLAQAL